MKTIILLLSILTVVGCANIVHKRTVVRVDAFGTNTTTESESGRFFFEKEAIQKLNIATRESGTNYTHTLSATGVSIVGDTDLARSIAEGAAKGAAEGAAAAGKP